MLDITVQSATVKMRRFGTKAEVDAGMEITTRKSFTAHIQQKEGVSKTTEDDVERLTSITSVLGATEPSPCTSSIAMLQSLHCKPTVVTAEICPKPAAPSPCGSGMTKAASIGTYVSWPGKIESLLFRWRARRSPPPER